MGTSRLRRVGGWLGAVLLITMWVSSAAAEEGDGPVIDLPPEQGYSAANESPTTLGGYGELEFTDVEGPGGRKVDFHRFVLFVSHHFADWVNFHSEVEIEHAEQIEMEQAVVEIDLPHDLTVRAGLILVPVGLTNLHHEPSLYHGAIRPRMDKVIIPTTWREAAIGLVYAPLEWLTIEAYVMSGLDAAGFSGSSGIRGGRQAVAKAIGNNIAFAGRVSVEPVLGLTLGLAGYHGNSGQGQFGLDVPVTIAEFDARYRNHGVEARVQAALVSIGDALGLSEALEDTIADQIVGFFVEVAYDVLDQLETDHQLLPFVRFEQYDTHASVDDSLTASADNARTDVIFGLSYRPIQQIVFKFDYQMAGSDGDDPDDQWDLGVGWMF